MEMRSLSLCLEAPGSCAAQSIESERRTAANTCVMPATPATRNVRSVASRDQGPSAASDETPEKAGKLMLSSDPIGSDGRTTVVDRTPGIPGLERRQGRPDSSRHCEAVKGVKPRWRADSSLAKINDQ
jgi:hypothetical protein